MPSSVTVMSTSEPGMPPAVLSRTGSVDSFSSVEEFMSTSTSTLAPAAPWRLTLMSSEEEL